MRLLRRSAVAVPPADDGTMPFTVMIDVYWSDAHGTRVVGWAHHGGAPVAQLALTTRSGSALATATMRPDLPPFFGDDPAVAGAGFSVYLAGPPDVHLEFTGVSSGVDVRCSMPAPQHALPVVATAVVGPGWRDAVRAAVAIAPDGPVLALGARTASLEADARVRSLFPGREVIGVDIHHGLGVQVVADVHELDRVFSRRSAAIIYSGSLLEHVAAPWLVARACADVLMPGGLALHHVPWAWPTHAAPNDFWRISTEGLRQLFGPTLGFEIIETGSEVDVRMHVQPDDSVSPEPRAELDGFGTTNSPASSWIVARKGGPPLGEVAWPYRGTPAADLAERYPIDGIGAPADGGSRGRGTVGSPAYNDESAGDSS